MYIAAKIEDNAYCLLGCDVCMNSGSHNTTLFCPQDIFVVSMAMFAPQDHCLDISDLDRAVVL